MKYYEMTSLMWVVFTYLSVFTIQYVPVNNNKHIPLVVPF